MWNLFTVRANYSNVYYCNQAVKTRVQPHEQYSTLGAGQLQGGGDGRGEGYNTIRYVLPIITDDCHRPEQ